MRGGAEAAIGPSESSLVDNRGDEVLPSSDWSPVSAGIEEKAGPPPAVGCARRRTAIATALISLTLDKVTRRDCRFAVTDPSDLTLISAISAVIAFTR